MVVRGLVGGVRVSMVVCVVGGCGGEVGGCGKEKGRVKLEMFGGPGRF